MPILSAVMVSQFTGGKLEIKFSSGFGCGQAFIKIKTSIGGLATFAEFTQGTHGTARCPESKLVGLAVPPIVHAIADSSRKAQFGSLRVVVFLRLAWISAVAVGIFLLSQKIVPVPLSEI